MGNSGSAPGEATKYSHLSAQGILDALLDTCDDAVVTCDLSGTVLTWSRSAELLFGVSAADVVGGPLESLFPIRMRPDIARTVNRAARGARIRHHQTEVVRTDGMPIPLTLSLCPIAADDGSPAGVMALARDVTEQRLAQATLAELDARLQESEALAHTGSWFLDLRTGVVQWSTEFFRIHDVDPLEFGGTVDSYLQALEASDRDHLRELIDRAAHTGRAFETEYRVTIDGGVDRRVRLRAEPAIGSDSTIVGLRGIGQQIGQP